MMTTTTKIGQRQTTATSAQPPGQHPGPLPQAAAHGVGTGATQNNGTNE